MDLFKGPHMSNEYVKIKKYICLPLCDQDFRLWSVASSCGRGLATAMNLFGKSTLVK